MTIEITQEERQQLLDRLIVGLPYLDPFATGCMEEFTHSTPIDSLRWVVEHDTSLYDALNRLYDLEISTKAWRRFFKKNKKMRLARFMDELFWMGAELKEVKAMGYFGARCDAAGYFLRLKEEMKREDGCGRFDRLRPSDVIQDVHMLEYGAPLFMALLRLKPRWINDPFGTVWRNGIFGDRSELINGLWCLSYCVLSLLGGIALALTLLIDGLWLGTLSGILIGLAVLLATFRVILGAWLVGTSEDVVIWSEEGISTYADLCRVMAKA